MSTDNIKPRFIRDEILGRQKLCAKCDEYFPADTEFFYGTPSGGLESFCIVCYCERKRGYKAKSRAKNLAQLNEEIAA